MVEVPASRLRLAAAVLRHLAGTKTTHAAIAAREHAAEFDRLTASPAASEVSGTPGGENQ